MMDLKGEINFNGIEWINDNLKFKSTLYSRKTLQIMMEVQQMKKIMLLITECIQFNQN